MLAQRAQRENGGMNFLEAIFSWVFGDGDPNADFDKMRWQAVGFLGPYHPRAVVQSCWGWLTNSAVCPTELIAEACLRACWSWPLYLPGGRRSLRWALLLPAPPQSAHWLLILLRPDQSCRLLFTFGRRSGATSLHAEVKW
jgi:hypothetical protein